MNDTMVKKIVRCKSEWPRVTRMTDTMAPDSGTVQWLWPERRPHERHSGQDNGTMQQLSGWKA